ncbi:MAG: hypothetical protein CFH05_00969, partial [Alphaproteobacteria bacterium MarineAlpha3_Bin4]
VEGVGQRIGRGESFADIGKIENGEVYHAAILAPCAMRRYPVTRTFDSLRPLGVDNRIARTRPIAQGRGVR